MLAPGSGLSARLYRHAPISVRGVFASLYGLHMLRVRYGRGFAERLGGFRERDGWSGQQIESFQNEKLLQLLRRAISRVPYYRRLHQMGKYPIEKVASAADLVHLPIVERESVRSRPEEFLAADPRGMQVLYTSGTTGTPTKLWRSLDTIRTWYACFERRAREWSGVKLKDRFAALGGQLVVPFEASRPPFWVWNSSIRQLYMSVYHLSPENMDSYVDEMIRREVIYSYGYASALDSIATHMIETGRNDLKLRVAISNAEPLLRHQRERIAEAFGAQVRDTYIPSELTVGAFECAAGRMHLSPELGILEVVRGDGAPCLDGEPGEFICTGLLNPDHVLIRYRQGDRGTMLPGTVDCACGVKMPALSSIDGRQDDVLMTADGRRIGRLDPVFKGGMAIREAQIIQVSLEQIQVKVVCAPGYSERDATEIRSRLKERMGAVTVTVIPVETIERTANGKLRSVVNLLERCSGGSGGMQP